MKKKIKLSLFSFYDNAGMEAYLEKMALKGWILENIYGPIHVYKKIEEENLKFSVQYLCRDSLNTNSDEGVFLEYLDMMEEAGWKYLTGSGDFFVFYSEDEDPLPVETDPEVEYRSIVKKFKKSALLRVLLLILYPFMLLKSNLSMIEYFPLDFFASNFKLLICVFFVLVISFSFLEIIFFGYWVIKSQNRLKKGKGLAGRKFIKRLEYTQLIIVPLVLILIVFGAGDIRDKIIFISTVILTLLLGIAFQTMNKKKTMRGKVDKRIVFFASVVILFVVYINIINRVSIDSGNVTEMSKNINGQQQAIYQDQIPLKIQDLTDPKDELFSYRLYERESLVISLLGVSQYPADTKLKSENIELSYDIARVKWSFLYDYLLSKELKASSMDFEDLDQDPAYVDFQVYKRNWGYNKQMWTFIILKDDLIIKIKSNFGLDHDNLNKTVDIIDGFLSN